MQPSLQNLRFRWVQTAQLKKSCARRGLIWRAPKRSRADERYTLSALKPGKVWISHSLAFLNRTGERLGL